MFAADTVDKLLLLWGIKVLGEKGTKLERGGERRSVTGTCWLGMAGKRKKEVLDGNWGV